jgi:serine/threonine protein kinase
MTSNGVLKLADFGLARIYEANSAASMSHQVATRQYRAPELLFASRHYTPAVDIWSAAVVMMELISLQVWFANKFSLLFHIPKLNFSHLTLYFKFAGCVSRKQ